MATVDPEFVAYMRTQNFTLEDATDVAEKVAAAGLLSASDFLGFYSTKGTDMYRFWADQHDWQGKGGILARLRHMFDNLEASAESAKQQDALLMDPEIDNPIDKKTHDSLTRTWLSLYGYRLHPTQEGTHQVLGSMWRSLLSRQITSGPIKALRTLHSTHGIEPVKKRLKIGQLDVLTNEDRKPSTQSHVLNQNPFLWLLALENFLRSLCKAGSYLVEDPEDERSAEAITARPKVLNVDRAPIEEHLAQCRAFILEWINKSKGNSDHLIFAQISRIDLAIRSKWTDEYRENMPPGVTFTRCMMKHKASAEQLWSTDLSRDMQPFPKHEKGEGKGAKPDRFAKQTAAAARQTKGAGKQKKGAAKGTAKGVSKTENSVKLGQPAFVANKKVMTAQGDGTKSYCSFFNKNGCTKAECAFLHKCNVLTSPTTVCGKDHPASKHVGATVASK